MKSLFEENDREEPNADADLTLGIGSLLSIFFGVVLICGIFFGFGYSMGRRNARATTAMVPAAISPAPSAATAPPLPENELSGTPLKPQVPDDSSSQSSDETNPAPNSTPEAHKSQPPPPS